MKLVIVLLTFFGLNALILVLTNDASGKTETAEIDKVLKNAVLTPYKTTNMPRNYNEAIMVAIDKSGEENVFPYLQLPSQVTMPTTTARTETFKAFEFAQKRA